MVKHYSRNISFSLLKKPIKGELFLNVKKQVEVLLLTLSSNSLIIVFNVKLSFSSFDLN